MKALPSLLLLSILAALPPSALYGQLPDGSGIQFENNAAASTCKVGIVDPGNHVWTLQSSPNLTDWTNVAVLKVHNGRLNKQLSYTAQDKQLFYRTSYSTANQSSVSSTTGTALVLPGSPYNYASPTLPASFSVNPIAAQDNMPGNNLTTDLGAKLGRVLFYDKRLSLNYTVSCASCHQPAHGFSDPRQFSVGFNGGLTGRNSMGLTNARWYQRRRFFWDERAATLEDQVLLPIQNAVEMGMTLTALEARLNAEPYYTDLFNQAFGTPTITSTLISRALAQFVRSIASAQSKYDIGVASTPQFANFTAEENQGRQIFNSPQQGNCAACHGTDNFVPGGGPPFNNGLENPYVDKGVGEVSGLAQDEGLFKVPSLRNIELTAPYMHDGRFATLEQVVEFYNSGVVNHPNLSGPMRAPGGQPRRLNLTTAQKAALVAFMKTLTDTTVTSDPKFSDPFNYGD